MSIMTLWNMTPPNLTSTNMTYPWGDSTEANMLEILAVGVMCWVAVGANLSLFLVVLTSRQLRDESNALLLSLSLADLLISAVSIPLTIDTLSFGTWRFSRATCLTAGYINMLAFTASVQNLAIISLNRYVKICRPARYVDIYTYTHVFLMCTGVWCVSGLISLPPLLGWAAYTYLPRAYICFCDWQSSAGYAFFMISFCFCLPCLVMTFSNVAILKAYTSSKKAVDSYREYNNNNRATKTLDVSRKVTDTEEQCKFAASLAQKIVATCNLNPTKFNNNNNHTTDQTNQYDEFNSITRPGIDSANTLERIHNKIDSLDINVLKNLHKTTILNVQPSSSVSQSNDSIACPDQFRNPVISISAESTTSQAEKHFVNDDRIIVTYDVSEVTQQRLHLDGKTLSVNDNSSASHDDASTLDLDTEVFHHSVYPDNNCVGITHQVQSPRNEINVDDFLDLELNKSRNNFGSDYMVKGRTRFCHPSYVSSIDNNDKSAKRKPCLQVNNQSQTSITNIDKNESFKRLIDGKESPISFQCCQKLKQGWRTKKLLPLANRRKLKRIGIKMPSSLHSPKSTTSLFREKITEKITPVSTVSPCDVLKKISIPPSCKIVSRTRTLHWSSRLKILNIGWRDSVSRQRIFTKQRINKVSPKQNEYKSDTIFGKLPNESNVDKEMHSFNTKSSLRNNEIGCRSVSDFMERIDKDIHNLNQYERSDIKTFTKSNISYQAIASFEIPNTIVKFSENKENDLTFHEHTSAHENSAIPSSSERASGKAKLAVLQLRHGTEAMPKKKISQSKASSYLSKNFTNRSEKRRREEFQLAASLFVVILLFVVCWFPYCVSIFMVLYSPDHSNKSLELTSVCLGYFNSCLNPVVYGVMNRKFKKAYKRLLLSLIKPFSFRKKLVIIERSSRLSL